jgi:predicted membrane protein
MRKLTVELIVIIILWLAILLSYLVSKSYDVPYIVGCIGLVLISVLYQKSHDMSLLLLVVLLFLAVFNIVTFSLAYNVHVWLFNVFPLVLLVVLVVKRKKKLVQIYERLIG